MIQLIKLLDETINQYRKVRLNMKKLTTIAILLATSSLASLTACNPPPKEEMLEKNGTDIFHLDYRTITLKDGRKLECVEYSSGYRYGISCNWNNPVNQNDTK